DTAGPGGGREEGAPEPDREGRLDQHPAAAPGSAPRPGRRDPAPHLGRAAAAHPGGAAVGDGLFPSPNVWGTVTVRRPEFRVQRATQVMVRLAPVSVVCWLLGTAPP